MPCSVVRWHVASRALNCFYWFLFYYEVNHSMNQRHCWCQDIKLDEYLSLNCNLVTRAEVEGLVNDIQWYKSVKPIATHCKRAVAINVWHLYLHCKLYLLNHSYDFDDIRAISVTLRVATTVYTGSAEQRGLTSWHPTTDSTDIVTTAATTTYDLPLITPLITRSRWTSFVPVFSSFNGFS